MVLPQNDNVLIPRKKLIDYILSETHATGKFKAKYFRSLGFDEANISLFIESSPYGTKYVIDGDLKTPSKRTVRVRTVWVIEKGQKRPRFITVYPV